MRGCQQTSVTSAPANTPPGSLSPPDAPVRKRGAHPLSLPGPAQFSAPPGTLLVCVPGHRNTPHQWVRCHSDFHRAANASLGWEFPGPVPETVQLVHPATQPHGPDGPTAGPGAAGKTASTTWLQAGPRCWGSPPPTGHMCSVMFCCSQGGQPAVRAGGHADTQRGLGGARGLQWSTLKVSSSLSSGRHKPESQLFPRRPPSAASPWSPGPTRPPPVRREEPGLRPA